MPEDGDHARSQAGHNGMGVSAAGLFCAGRILLTSPATDDPIIMILIAMGISGIVMLVFGGLCLAARIRKSREAKKAEKDNRK